MFNFQWMLSYPVCATHSIFNTTYSTLWLNITTLWLNINIVKYHISGTYQGQWLRGMRHGYGVRASAPFGLASHYRGGSTHAAGARDNRGSVSSLVDAAGTPDPTERRTTRMDDARGGFVLKASSDEPSGRRGSLVEKTKKGLLSVSIQPPNNYCNWLIENWKNISFFGHMLFPVNF